MLVVVSHLLLVIKSSRRDAVHGQDSLVGFSHQDVFAIWLLMAELDEHSYHTPHLPIMQCDLTGKISRTIKLCRQNDVLIGTLLVDARTKSNLHLVRSSKERLGRPLSKLETIVLEFIGQHSTPLSIDLVAPEKSDYGSNNLRNIAL
jgi:hypothetical protein